VTGEAMADLLTGGAPDPVLAPFNPGRFRW